MRRLRKSRRQEAERRLREERGEQDKEICEKARVTRREGRKSQRLNLTGSAPQ